jgi:hypothetical protein
MDRSPKIDMDEARSRYIHDRVEGQMNHFSEQLQKAKIDLGRRRAIMKACSYTALVCAFVVLLLTILGYGPKLLHQWLHFFELTLPLMATAMGVTLITQEAVRRSIRYDEMLHELRRLRHQLNAVRTWDALARVATEIEEELLQELVEWRSFVRFTRDVVRSE